MGRIVAVGAEVISSGIAGCQGWRLAGDDITGEGLGAWNKP